jgi:hypothetical protein
MTVSLLYITDKTGNRFWKTTVTTDYAQGERNNLQQRLTQIKNGNPAFAFIDSESAQIVEETN